MPHSNPSPDQIQAMKELITKLLGWKKMCCDNQLKYPHWHVKEQCFLGGGPPNWLGDRNASYKLIEDLFRPYQDERDALSAEEECMLYIRDKGYRWETCDSCEGQPHGVSEDCTDCNGQGGKFVKEVTDE